MIKIRKLALLSVAALVVLGLGIPARASVVETIGSSENLSTTGYSNGNAGPAANGTGFVLIYVGGYSGGPFTQAGEVTTWGMQHYSSPTVTPATHRTQVTPLIMKYNGSGTSYELVGVGATRSIHTATTFTEFDFDVIAGTNVIGAPSGGQYYTAAYYMGTAAWNESTQQVTFTPTTTPSNNLVYFRYSDPANVPQINDVWHEYNWGNASPVARAIGYTQSAATLAEPRTYTFTMSLTAVPEPATGLASLFGLGLLGFVRRRVIA